MALPPSPALKEVIEELTYQQIGYWLTAGGVTLLFYDWLLCMDREARYLWKARWSFGKVLFICHRYAMMVLVIGFLYGSVKSSTGPTSPEWCIMWDKLSYFGSVIVIGAIQGSQRKAAPILSTFFRDGVTYFGIVFLTALVNILFFITPWAVKGWMTNYLRPLLSSMATRLLLNLHKEVYTGAHFSSDAPTTVVGHTDDFYSTVKFAHNTVGESTNGAGTFGDESTYEDGQINDEGRRWVERSDDVELRNLGEDGSRDGERGSGGQEHERSRRENEVVADPG
ncbi:hypothetical protein FRB90_006346 [Tulasnella sp. 427]|nr:hypothetical protein FRB90_006346 [Tulasnella sp. 427]